MSDKDNIKIIGSGPLPDPAVSPNRKPIAPPPLDPNMKSRPKLSSDRGPRVYTFNADKIDIIETDEYIVQEIFFTNSQNETLWSKIYFTLKGFSQSPWFSNQHRDMRYEITEGEAWFLIDIKGQVVRVGDMVCVPVGKNHMIMNNSNNACKYNFDSPGLLDMRTYLGIPLK